MYAWQFATMLHIAEANGWTRFATMQNYLNLLYREEEREMLPLCAAEGVGVIPWSPLARGRLTRDWDETTERSQTDEFGKTLYAQTVDADGKVVEAVAAVARERGVSRAQVALAWVLAKPDVSSPIIGASKEAHLDDALAALTLGLTEAEITRLEAPYVPHAIVGFA
jgi:aryl-alcohol dehydrogenase-like predicted oxidoreductase